MQVTVCAVVLGSVGPRREQQPRLMSKNFAYLLVKEIVLYWVAFDNPCEGTSHMIRDSVVRVQVLKTKI